MPGAGLAQFPVLNPLQQEMSTLHRGFCTHKKNKKAKKTMNSAALQKNCYENGRIFCSGTDAMMIFCRFFYTPFIYFFIAFAFLVFFSLRS